MNFGKIILAALSFLTIAFCVPIPQDEIQGEIATPPPGRWQGAWQSAKSFFSKLVGYTGATDAGTLLTRIGQATTFYNMLRENPQQLIENLKRALANALSQATLNPQQSRQLEKDAAVLKTQLQQASQQINERTNNNNRQGSDSDSEIAGSISDNQAQVRSLQPEVELNEN